jgi:flagellar basal body-associated protein FliL
MKKKNKNILIFSALIVAAIAVGSGLFFLTLKQAETPTPQIEKSGSDNDTKANTPEKESDTTQGDPKTPIQYEGQGSSDNAPDYDNERFRIPEGE